MRFVSSSLPALAVAACAALSSAAAFGGPIAADLFTTPQLVTAPGGGGSASGQVDGAGILGGNREVLAGQGSGVNRLVSTVGSGLWTIAPLSGVDVDQGFARMTWDRSGGSTSAPDFGGPGFDLTGGGTNDRWLMTYRTPTLLSFWNTKLKLYTDGGNWIQYEVAGPVSPGSGTYNGIGNVLDPGLGAGGITRAGSVDFTRIRAVELTLSEPRSADESFRIDVIGLFFLGQDDRVDDAGRVVGTTTPGEVQTSVVPVPGSAALLFSALVLSAGFLRRRRS
jgi:hypothetical protein